MGTRKLKNGFDGFRGFVRTLFIAYQADPRNYEPTNMAFFVKPRKLTPSNIKTLTVCIYTKMTLIH